MSDADPRREPGYDYAPQKPFTFPVIDPIVANVSIDSITAFIADPGPAQYGTTATQHEMLSKVLYDIAKIAEQVNMSPANEALVKPGVSEPDRSVGDAMEQIIVMIATAPLTQHYAAKLAFEK